MKSQPFARARAMMELIITAVTSGLSASMVAPTCRYESRGKGGKRPVSAGNGADRVKRAARKARNVRRHREACRS